MQQCGDLSDAHYCFQKSALGQYAQRSPWHAAKAMERAGEAARDAGQLQSALASFEKAMEWYLEEGKQEGAAEAASRAARAMEDADPGAASRYYKRSLELIEDSGKEALYAETYRQATAHAIRSERWAEAVALLLQFAMSCDRCGARLSQRKSYLGAVVVWLAAENVRAAWDTYQDALAVSEFASSDEAWAAEALFDAYRSGDSDAIIKCIKLHQCFMNLEPTVARLARKLPKGNVSDLARDTSALSGAPQQLGVDEDDLT